MYVYTLSIYNFFHRKKSLTYTLVFYKINIRRTQIYAISLVSRSHFGLLLKELTTLPGL